MSKILPLISVIIPAYNEEKFLGKCLRSLINQTLSKDEYEIIVVDNASTDNTLDVAKQFPVKIAREPIQSVVVARQTGVNESIGKIIVSADADTLYPPQWLLQIKKDFKKNPKIVALVGWIYFTKTSMLFNLSIALNQELNLLLQRLNRRFPIVFACNFSFKRSALEKIGGYPIHLPELGDQQYLLHNFHKLGKVIIDKNIYCYTSGRRHKSKIKNIVVYNGWHRLIGYTVNRLLGRQIIGPAPAIRTPSSSTQKSHYWQRND